MTSLHIETPLIESRAMGENLTGNVYLKMEAMQPCGSFKARGIGHACKKHVESGANALVSSSGGNAGLAVAWSGRKLQVPVTVVVPKTTKQRAIDLIELEGARVIVTGDNCDEAHQHAVDLSQHGAAYIHPFDDPMIWQGHASIVDEISNAGIRPDAIILSVGGGGLLCGVVEGLQANGWSDVPVLAVETQGANSLNAAVLANRHVSIDAITSIATSLGAKKVAQRAFDLLSEHNIVSHVVTDSDAVDSCYRFLDDHRALVEPACGASLSAVYKSCDFLKDKKNIVVIVCGGIGVTMDQLGAWRRSAEVT